MNAIANTVKSFFRPANEVQHLRRIVGVLSALLAVCVVAILVHELEVSRRPPTYVQLSDSDRLGMIILSDHASRK